MILARVILPWAKTSDLSMNARIHWRRKHKLITEQKFVADALAREAKWHKIDVPADVPLLVTLTCCPPSRCPYPDDDNFTTAQKGALDALADVLNVNDRRFKLQPVMKGDRSKNGGVIVEIRVAA